MLAISVREAFRDAIAAFGAPGGEVPLAAPATHEAIFAAVRARLENTSTRADRTRTAPDTGARVTPSRTHGIPSRDAMPRNRLALFVLVSLATASGCIEEPRRTRPAAESNREAPTRAPVAIGYGDSSVPQVHFPPRIFPPHVAESVIPLGPHAALTSAPGGGALLLWSTLANTPRPISQIALRAIGPDGTPGPIWDVRRTTGTVQGMDISMRGDEAMMIWNAQIGAIASQISAERVRPDGTLVGDPFGIGTYRVAEPEGTDAGVDGNRLGFPARVVPTANGFAVAVRGTLARCGTGLCPAVRVAEIDSFNVIHGAGGVQNNDPGPVVTLLGTQQVPFTLAMTFGGDRGPAHIETFGPGPLSRIGLRDGTLVGAWLHDGAAQAIVQQTQNPPQHAQTLQLVTAGSADAGTVAAVDRVSTGCQGGVAVVTLSGPNGTTSVRADEPGAGELFAWALDYIASASARARGTHATTPAADDHDQPSDTVWIRDGLLVARPSRLELMRCQGNSLGAATTIPWTAPAADAATP